jgi:hypothetical protein
VSGAEYYEPDAKLLSVAHGGIREQLRAKSENHGVIRDPNETSSVEHGVIHGRCGTQSVEYGAIRHQHAGRKVSEYGEIRRPARKAQYRARSNPGAVQGASRGKRSNSWTARSTKCRVRSDP